LAVKKNGRYFGQKKLTKSKNKMQEKNRSPLKIFGNNFLLVSHFVGAFNLRDPKANGENEKRYESGQRVGKGNVFHWFTPGY
jgi:hypothetical protein